MSGKWAITGHYFEHWFTALSVLYRNMSVPRDYKATKEHPTAKETQYFLNLTFSYCLSPQFLTCNPIHDYMYMEVFVQYFLNLTQSVF